ncbi:MAG TPA: 50S ribosomal protein L24 [Candidatus Woesearchaeota archaeon]|nr:50S ribosomal protein L24 [Candidatus Woesearchaeota archaeon]
MKTKNPRKARKAVKKGSNNVLRKLVSVHLSPELRKKYSTRSLGLRTGDTVKVLRGKYSKKLGKVERLNLQTQRVYIEGIEVSKADGTKSKVGLMPSNLMITHLDLTDKWRSKIIERKGGKVELKTKEAKK